MPETPVDLAAARQRIERAHTEIGQVCAEGPSRRFRMHIPADPERDTDLIVTAALNDAELLAGEVEQLRAEVARLRAGEADTPGEEGAEPTPAQWIRRWNDATPKERLQIAEAGRANAQAAYRCFLMDHEGRLADAEDVARQDQTGAAMTDTRAWPCSREGCADPAAYAVTLRGQPGHVHDCVAHTAVLREWADVGSVVPLPCPHPHGDGTTWVDTPRPLETGGD